MEDKETREGERGEEIREKKSADFARISFDLAGVQRYVDGMSSDGEPAWESLPPQLRTSQLAHAICPEGAADAADNLDTRLFWGRVVFHNFSQAELSAYLWRKWGEQLRG